ncbi:hypothetical protein RBH66_11025 [Escherichia coli]|nr:hypothetical protein [Escherichia coli]MEC9784949.1 hypothetical protein [Escherichia coli]
MQQVNVFACVGDVRSGCVRSGLVRIHSIYATALKPPREAGGRGGESTARQTMSLACSYPVEILIFLLHYS